MQAESVDINGLHFDPSNARLHSNKNLDAIKGSLTKFGQQTPIVIDERGVVLKGNGTVAAARALGWQQIWAIRAKLSEVQKAAYAIADNRSSELATWDNDVLAKTILALRAEDFGLVDIGFDDLDLKKILGEDFEERDPNWVDEKEDEVPESAPARVSVGDVWILGSHRIVCGDSTSRSSLVKLMGDSKADMAFVDPPYNTGMTPKTQDGSTWLSHMFNDNFTDEAWLALLTGFTSELHWALKDDSVAYICLDWRRNHELIPHIERHFKRSNMIVWDKLVHGLGSDYKYTHELINVCKKGSPELYTNLGEKEFQDVWRIQRKMGRDDDHATKKPIELVERAISHASKPGDLVLDVFLGSGSTLIAAEKTGRRCVGIEIEPKYCDIILQRWENLTGLKAEKVEGVEG